MSLVLLPAEEMLVDSLRRLLARFAPLGEARRLRNAPVAHRYTPGLWPAMIEAGFAAPQLPETEGGLGMGYAAAGLVAEELGRVLAATPFLSTALSIELLLAARAPQGAALLSGLAHGALHIAAAIDEAPRHDPTRLSTRAVPTQDGWRIDGRKRCVIDLCAAGLLIVAAADEAGAPLLILVDAAAPGLSIMPLDLIDASDAADAMFEAVHVAPEAVLAHAGQARHALDRALDVGRALLAAELLGIAQEAFDRTLVYLKQREQFGRKIGAFQALQHRAARLHINLELARGVVLKLFRALDDHAADASDIASLAKAACTKTAREVMNEAVQMHGGIGVTDALDIGLFFKRARVAGETFGDDYFHCERIALRKTLFL